MKQLESESHLSRWPQFLLKLAETLQVQVILSFRCTCNSADFCFQNVDPGCQLGRCLGPRGRTLHRNLELV